VGSRSGPTIWRREINLPAAVNRTKLPLPSSPQLHSHTLAHRLHHAVSLLHRAALINVKIDKPLVSQTLSRPYICLGKKAPPPIRLLYHVSLVTNVRMRGAFLRIPMMISKDCYQTLPVLVALQSVGTRTFAYSAASYCEHKLWGS
jgi:hypothetical protein